MWTRRRRVFHLRRFVKRPSSVGMVPLDSPSSNRYNSERSPKLDGILPVNFAPYRENSSDGKERETQVRQYSSRLVFEVYVPKLVSWEASLGKLPEMKVFARLRTTTTTMS